MISRKTANSLLISAVSVIAAGGLPSQGEAHAIPADKEKCYGVARAGANDCASASGTHSCAASAAADGAKDEWVAVPKGLCEKLVGGSLEGVAADKSPAGATTKKP